MTKQRRALVGRGAELARFDESLDRALKGQPTLLLFEGEPGSGKTTLLDTLATSPGLSALRTRALRIDAGDGDAADPVQRAADLITHARLFARVGGRTRIGAVASKLLPDWLGAVPIIGDILEAITVTFQAIRRRSKTEARTNVAEDIGAIHKYARNHSAVVLIDNLQEINEVTADRLLRLVNAAPDRSRLLVVGMARTPPPGTAQPPFRILQNRTTDERLCYHRLEAFALGDMHQWLNARFHEKPLPPAVINFLLTETGGQPGLVLRVIDELIERKIIRETDEGWMHDSLIGAEVAATDEAESYLGSLHSDVAEIVRAASIFGDEFDALTLAQLLEMDELDLEDRLAVAVRFGLLNVAGEWTLEGGEISTLYRFASTAVRASLYRSLTATQRQAFETRMSTL